MSTNSTYVPKMFRAYIPPRETVTQWGKQHDALSQAISDAHEARTEFVRQCNFDLFIMNSLEQPVEAHAALRKVLAEGYADNNPTYVLGIGVDINFDTYVTEYIDAEVASVFDLDNETCERPAPGEKIAFLIIDAGIEDSDDFIRDQVAIYYARVPVDSRVHEQRFVTNFG